jgi:hypothetical protein
VRLNKRGRLGLFAAISNGGRLVPFVSSATGGRLVPFVAIFAGGRFVPFVALAAEHVNIDTATNTAVTDCFLTFFILITPI